MPRRYTIEFVRGQFENEGYTLLVDEYVNRDQRLDYICPKHHKHYITFGGWSIGNRCPYCSGKVKKTIEFIRNELLKDGYTLLSDKYQNSHTKFDYKCSSGHNNSINWNNWYTGYRCPTCYYLSKFGETNSNWKGGIDTSPYCVVWKDDDFKGAVKERDGYKCLNPYCRHVDDMLSVHHIDYDKGNCGFNNLITVCRSCNSIANTDREWHMEWYRAILKKRYNYNY